MTGWLEGAAVIGKVESEYEFLRAGQADAPGLRAFDGWLFRNASPGSALAEDAPEPPAYAFAARVDPGELSPALTVGVLAPTRDRAGRRYAAAIVATFSAAGGSSHPETLPVLLEGYWSEALEALAFARSSPPSAHNPRLAELTARPVEPVEAALELYAGWTRATTCGDVCAMLDRDPAWLDAAVDAVARAVRPARSRPSRDVYGARVPLGAAAGATLCFWLDVVGRASGRAGPCPSFFWSHDGQSGHALLLLPGAPDGTLAMLWGGAPGDHVADVTRPELPGSLGARRGPGDATLGALLGDGRSPVADLLDLVG